MSAASCLRIGLLGFALVLPLSSHAVVRGVFCMSSKGLSDYNSIEMSFNNPKGTYLEALPDYPTSAKPINLSGITTSVSLDQQVATDEVRLTFHFVDEDGKASDQNSSLKYDGRPFTTQIGATDITCNSVDLVGSDAKAAEDWRP